MDGSGFFLILVLLIAGIFALGIWNSGRAKREHETVVALSPARARQIVEDSFGKMLWADVSGPGHINKRRRTINDTGATISVVIEPLTDGKTHVTAWMSAWKTQYGMVTSGGWPLAKKVIAKLDQTQA
ncbi:hypothetical protein Q9R30_18455 [Arthrobacter sp. AB6]|uniref:hypothetical protein n=1 Tax=Arthrobacter sp. AB6 TaxID=2962570 RepID=UPI0028827BD4|nr:hypothetical protein [Arthrobacter sp. AB6]MDT0197332.1 hypothetical protein [Arthrobacter sp. AB6]